MNSSLYRLINWIAICLFLTGLVAGQDYLTGSITYVSKDNAYMDLGKKSGLSQGDTVMVVRGEIQLGVALIDQISGSSSALKAFQPEDISWKIGDATRIHLSGKQSELPVIAAQTDTIIAKPETKEVFLDSSAYVSRSSTGTNISGRRFAPRFSGYLSSRLDDRGGGLDSKRRTTGTLFSQFKLMDVGVRHLNASMSMRSSQSSADTSFSTQLYTLMFMYKQPEKPFSILIGRMYHPQFSMLGTVDGLGITWQNKKRTIAALGGKQAPIFKLENRPQRQKYGILGVEHYQWGDIQFGNIGERENGVLARNYLILGSTYRIKSGLRLRFYSEADLDLMDQSPTQTLISITRFRTSVNWRLLPSLMTSLRYSYRENIIDLLDTTATEFDQAARHALNSNLSWMSNTGLSVSGQFAYRTDGGGKNLQIYGLNINKRSFTRYNFTLASGSMVMLSYLSEGGRLYTSLGKKMNSWLDVDIYDELFLYRIIGESSFRIRHLPEISIVARVPVINRLRFRVRLEQESGETLYRFSLSASQQF